MAEATATGPAPRGKLHPAAEPREAEPAHGQRPSDDEREPREGDELIDAAARVGKDRREKLNAEEQVDALEWFLSDVSEDLTDDIQINVGTGRTPKWLTWTIKPVDLDKLRRIRRQSSQGNRRSRITGQPNLDADNANLRIVIEGTVYPDLHAASKQIGTVDPADAVRIKFKHKPGLIDQIAGEIMSLSGYDDDDVREADAARG